MDETEEKTSNNIARDSLMMTGLVFISRLTGFVRTWAQAFALGATMLASCYTVANNIPNLLFEITIGGMLYTAFLPVYMTVKNKAGKKGASDYVSNMTSIILLLMTIMTIVAFIFAAPLVFTQSAGADESFSFDTATLFFRFFCVEVLLYPLSALLGAVLNAERKYFWGQASPIFNNIVVIASFLIGFQVAQTNEFMGFLIYAIGNPLGVFVQVILQIAPMRRAGIKIKLKINWHDPELKETLKIGLPSFLNTICAAVLASVQSSWSLVSNDSGAAILYYVRVWFVLPASLFAVPISTATFTELSDLFSLHKMDAFKERTIKGARQILFMMIPFCLYLIVFAPFLMAFFASGNFSSETYATSWVTLIFISTALPFYALVSYLQNVCAALHNLRFFSFCYVVFTIVSCAFCIVVGEMMGLVGVVLSITLFNLLMTVAVFVRIRVVLGHIGIGQMLRNSLVMFLLSCVGALAGGAIAYSIGNMLLGDAAFYTVAQSFISLLFGGLVAVVATYGLAMLFHVPESELIRSSLGKIKSKIHG